MNDEPETITSAQWARVMAEALMERDATGRMSAETMDFIRKVGDGSIVVLPPLVSEDADEDEDEDESAPEPSPRTFADPEYRVMARKWARPPHENATEKRLADLLNEAIDEIESMQGVLQEKIIMDESTAAEMMRLADQNAALRRERTELQGSYASLLAHTYSEGR